MSEATVVRRPIGLAFFLIVMGAIGWFAAFQLTIEKFAVLADPDATLTCDFSPLVQCKTNLESAQGSLLGFPNPILGLAGWVAPIAVGVALLAGARFDAWFWWLFNIGVACALALVIFLIITSIFVLGVLCPWCMVTWVVTIATFWMLTLRNVSRLVFRRPRMSGSLVALAVGLSIVSYLVIAALAQARLNVLFYL